VSYGLYLWQLPAFRAVERWCESWPQLARAGAGLVLLAALTLVSWFAVERPMLAVKERLSARWRAQDGRDAAPALT